MTEVAFRNGMKPKKHVHLASFVDRSGRITVTEERKRIVIELWFSKIGPWPGCPLDENPPELMAWLWPILHEWEQDRRPMIFKNGNGETVWEVFDLRPL